MEKILQQQLLEMLQTLEEGICYIGREGNLAMLRECITAIQAIREACQQSLPHRRQSVYVDLFAGMVQALQQLPEQADRATLQQVTALCQELIEYARQALQKELTRKKIMVFLPYKASMWDSLESVWKAAYEDKDHCETYVIPIPYCDRNPDMTAKEWHCEINLFPDYVPVLDWRDYNRDKLRDMHPDVIFIHNPYDNFNAVTSVDMQYYSRNLKGIADKLVYIPYFVMGDTIPPHFCQTQGVINADYVIVQDDTIKEQYERYYPGGNPPEGKILALGSPKFDKVCNATKDDYTLPAEWQHLIGSKKVILYNTSLTAMLEHVDKFNAKLRYVFDIFKQRDDVVLWWRPHPLLRATIDSMTPELRDEYCQIEQQYIKGGWGIYDDTPDMNRAIVCTDGYYGDMSSLVWLYKATKKNIVIEDFNRLTPSDTYRLWFHACVIDKEDMFFVPYNFNGLFRFNMKAGTLQHLKTLPVAVTDIWRYGQIHKDGNNIYITPAAEENLIVYDLVNAKCKTYPVDHTFVKSDWAQSIRSYKIGNKIWMVPNCGRAVVSFDLVTKQSIAYPQVFEYVPFEEREIYPLYGASIQLGNDIWFLYAHGNRIFQFDTNSGETCMHIIGEVSREYRGIVFDGADFWLYSKQGILVNWNPSDGVKREINNPLSMKRNFGDIRYINGKIWIFADYVDDYVVYDVKTGFCEKHIGYLKKSDGLGAAMLADGEEAIYILPSNGSLMVRIDAEKETVQQWNIQMDAEIERLYRREYIDNFQNAKVEWSMDSLFDIVKFCMNSKNKKNVKHSDIGKSIYLQMAVE